MYNDGVLCRWRDERVCARCGWKPDVWEERKKKLYPQKKTGSAVTERTFSDREDTKGEENT